MTVQAEHINPTMETSFMEIEVRNPSTGFSRPLLPSPSLLPPRFFPLHPLSTPSLQVRARDRLRPVDAVLPKRPLDGASGKRQRRGDFDFKGKARAEVRAAIALATPPPPV